MSRIRYDRLPTERVNPGTRSLDRLSAGGIARLMNRADRRAVRAVGRAAPALGRAVDLIVRALSRARAAALRGRRHQRPPGRARGRGVPADLRHAAVAGAGGDRGRQAHRVPLVRGRGGRRRAEGARQIRRRVRPGDMVVGIAASGVTPFVRAALQEARSRGAATALVTCNPACPPPRPAW